MFRHDTPQQDFKRIIADQLAAFEQKENEMNARDRRDRAEALGLPLALAAPPRVTMRNSRSRQPSLSPPSTGA